MFSLKCSGESLEACQENTQNLSSFLRALVRDLLLERLLLTHILMTRPIEHVQFDAAARFATHRRDCTYNDDVGGWRGVQGAAAVHEEISQLFSLSLIIDGGDF